MNPFSRRAIVLFLSAALLAGCGSPATPEARDNRRVFDELLTAITLHNARLLEKSAARVRARAAEQFYSAEERRELEAIIAQAASGEWTGAEKAAYAFRKLHPFVRPGER